MVIRLQTEDFDLSDEFERLRARCNGVGAIVSFVGLVRDAGDGEHIHALTLEHYPAMTEKALIGIADEATRRWPVSEIAVIHRFGDLDPGDQIVLVLVASPHRREAFLACEYVIDALKTRAPFWKKEHAGGGERWVQAAEADEAALATWSKTADGSGR
jgi:molybdopterin synthase catalytic subunit